MPITNSLSKPTVCVIGGGAAGFFSAIHIQLASPNSAVIIIEKSADLLTKVKISGGGRCNVTHACFDPKRLIDHYPRGHKELRGPFQKFQPKDTMEWFQSHGVDLKIEADNRVFPVSNSSQSIVDCLINTATHLGIKIWTNTPVKTVTKEGESFKLTLDNETPLYCQKLILATGSNRSGYDLATQLGHTIVPPVPSLFTFTIPDPALHQLSGLSVERTSVYIDGQKKQAQIGPLLITHWGVSGPSILRLSAWHAILLHDQRYKTTLTINWLADLTPQEIKTILKNTQATSPKKQIGTHSPFAQLPTRLWVYLIQKASLSPTHPWHTLTQKHLDILLTQLTETTLNVTQKGPFKEEFVTCGGVDLKEIDFKTMQSKHCPNLHIIGELLNIDGITGGFNFQNAWTTAYLSALTDQPVS